MSDIFISYASEDRDRAEVLAAALEARGWSVWWDRTIPPGKTFDEVIEEALDASSCVIVLWSQAAVASRWVRAEAGEGLKRGILIPVLIEDVELPLAFRQIHAAGLIDWQGEPAHPGFGQLVGAVSGLLGERAAKGGREEAAPRAEEEKAKGKVEQEEQRKSEEEPGQEAERDETRKDEEKEPTEIETETAKRRRLWIAAAAVVLALAGIGGVYQYNQYVERMAEIRRLEEMQRVAMEEERRLAAEEARQAAEEAAIREAEDARSRKEEEARRQAEEEARREQAAEAHQERVREAQSLLAELGYAPGRADGKVGPATERAIARFKRKTGLPGHAVVDAPLLVALRDAVRAGAGETPGRLAEGQDFQDCPECPEMVVVPAGRFVMGSPDTERERDNDEGPRHRVTISRPFAVGKYEITFAEWDACVAGGGCGGYRPPDRGWGHGRQPVINVNRDDALAYGLAEEADPQVVPPVERGRVGICGAGRQLHALLVGRRHRQEQRQLRRLWQSVG
jgi:hypothetical protein